MTLNEMINGVSYMSGTKTISLYINMKLINIFTVNEFIGMTFPDDIKMDDGTFMIIGNDDVTFFCVKGV